MQSTKRMEELVADRVPFVHAVVVRAQLPTAVSPGDDAIILPDGSIEGFVGGQCAESSVRTAALGALQDGRTVLLRVLPSDEQDFPDSPGARVVVNPCLSGGALEIFLQPLLPPPVLWVSGDSPIAVRLADLAATVDFAVRRAADGQSPTGAAAAVVASHGRDEQTAIRAALDAGAGYIGLVASHRRGTAVLDEMGLTDDERRRVHSPAGLRIGARTAPEIALSILAEIVAALRTGDLAPAGSPGLAPSAGSSAPAGSPSSVGSSVPVGSPSLVGSSAPAGSPAPAEVSDPAGAPAGAAGAPVLAVDPVCGMSVAVSTGTPHLVVDGEDVWFCGTGCRDHFAQAAGR
ncbi:XdhC family protein [Nonomuraea sp. NPDC048916]|uniref:XdhC family protein n=1 Tax=Nonomuraea sp. NPDC048916 TaxID=3154232 RepID=UPI0033C353D0